MLHLEYQVSISPICYEQLFCAKVFCTAFMCLQFGFVMFLRKDFGAKAAHKMLVKLTPRSTNFKNCNAFFCNCLQYHLLQVYISNFNFAINACIGMKWFINYYVVAMA